MMNAHAGNVLPKNSLMTESVLKRLISVAVTGVRHRRSISPKELADRLFVDVGTINNAEDGEHKLQPHTLFNLLTIDAFALEGLLHHFGRRSVPIEAKCSTDPLPDLSAAVHHLAVAQSPTSPSGPAISHGELLDMLPALEAAQEVLSGLIVRARKVAA